MKKIVALFMVVVSVASCISYDNYYKLDDKYLERRQFETRRFEAKSEDEMLTASAQVLQDLGFTIDESETNLGLITVSKDREAGSTGAMIGITILNMFSGQGRKMAYDTKQKIYATLVSSKSKEGKGFNVRIEFSRIVWNSNNETRVERIDDPEIYKDFFDKLGKSLFLVANNI